MYEYEKGKENNIIILNSKTTIEEKDSIPKDDSLFTYENEIKTWVVALFVDIKDSTNMFKK